MAPPFERLPDLDLGDKHELWFFGWHPDRDLNPQFADLPDLERSTAVISHLTPTGEPCWGAINFSSPQHDRVFGPRNVWQVESWDPLTISPSVLCKLCGDHGFIRAGKWVRAG